MTERAALSRVEDAISAAGGFFRQRGADTYRSNGICHGGQRSESLVIFYDPARGHVNVHCHAGCERDLILDALRLTEADLYDEPWQSSIAHPLPRPPVPPPPAPRILPAAPHGWRPAVDSWMPCKHRKIAEYLYATADACVAFGVCRCEHKCFAQWRPDPSARTGRRWGVRETDERGRTVATVPAVPYMLPQLLAGIRDERTIWVVEGEKDVLRLVAEGMVATCNAGGGGRGKWAPEHAAYLEGADVCIVADRDKTGREHAESVVKTLMPLAHSVEVVQARHGKDASDHLDAGGTLTDFIPVWAPKPFVLKETA